MKTEKIFLTILAGILMASSPVASQGRPQKKIVEFCHVTSSYIPAEDPDVLYPGVVLKNIREMQKQPFDGLILRLRDYNHMSDIRPWKRADLKPQIDTLTKIEWGRFTDNFLFLYTTDMWDMNWFNDDQWNIIVKNMKLISEAAKAGGFVGICLDIEPYGKLGASPFQYPGLKDKYALKPFAEVAAKARQRGAQFIKALQTDMPKMKFLQFFQLAIFESVFDVLDPLEREQKLTGTNSNPKSFFTKLSLAYPFFLGMLEGAGPNITFIDGNEGSYYYESPDQFYRAYHTIRNRALGLIPEELRTKYQAQVQVGTSIYMNQMMGRYRGSAVNFSPEDRLRFFEHNLYYALQTSDEYVWFYTDWPFTWWYDVLPGKSGQPFPDGTEEAMRSARLKYEQGKPLGFDLIREIAAAKEKAKAATEKK